MRDVRDLLARVGQRPAAEWSAALASELPDDAELRAQALLWLHADRESATADAELALAGERYELAMRIDTGATATVWQAHDRKLGRDVAIKVFATHDEQVLAEARAASDVISDHVVRILDVNTDEVQPYIVMELVGEHDPARDVIALGTSAAQSVPGSPDEVARWVMQIARGVHDAHLRNVFHRDLKPQNVLVTPMTRRARITDFGLAISGSTEPAQRGLTMLLSGPDGPLSVRGTPEYMAPEQARGLPPSLDPREARERARLVAVDVWGLGAIAFHLLYGRPPWLRDSERSAWEIAAAGDVPPLPARTSRGERIPDRLRAIVERMLVADPAARYATAALVAHELQAYLAREPTSFERSRRQRLALWTRRNPQLAMTVLLSTALAALTLVTHATVQRLRSERDALDREVTTHQAARRELDQTAEKAQIMLARTTARLITVRSNLQILERSLDTRTCPAQ